MKVKVVQRPGKIVPESNIHTKHGSPVNILSPALDWKSNGQTYKRVFVEVWSPIMGWKEMMILETNLVYT